MRISDWSSDVCSSDLYAARLGMNNSHFADASGLPDPNHYTTARDLTILARALIHDFPDWYKIFAERDFTYNQIHQPNRNGLLEKDRSEEHTSELQSLMRISYAVFCLKKKNTHNTHHKPNTNTYKNKQK